MGRLMPLLVRVDEGGGAMEGGGGKMIEPTVRLMSIDGYGSRESAMPCLRQGNQPAHK